jgi:hypothetical protein
MGYTQVELERKLYEMYPELEREGITLALSFDAEKNAWVVRFQKGPHSRYAFLDKKDADACIDGLKCIYLGTLVAQYVKDLQEELRRGP